jgi:hypothetical protein
VWGLGGRREWDWGRRGGIGGVAVGWGWGRGGRSG